MNLAWVVFRKELVDHLRDRRSLISSAAVTVFSVTVFVLSMQMTRPKEDPRPLRIPTTGWEAAPDLARFFESHGAALVPAPADPEAAVRAEEVPFVLNVEAEFSQNLAQGRSAKVQLLTNPENMKAAHALGKVRALLRGYSEQLATLRVLARGVTPELLAPLAIEEHSVATPDQLAARLLLVLPMLLISATLVGGTNVAIDSTAGERERGSLEALLLNPVPRAALCLGKWAATALGAISIGALTLAALAVTLARMGENELSAALAVGPATWGWLLLTLVCFALVAAACQLLLSTFARSFKEAQTHLSLFTLAPLLPSVIVMMMPHSAKSWMMAVPSLGHLVCMVRVLEGHLPTPLEWSLMGASSALCTVGCLVWLTRLLERESVVFGRGSGA
jgi:sodium transport system permease protein